MLHEVYTWTKTSLGVEYIDVIFAFTLESQSRPCIGPSKRGRTKADMLPLGPCPVYASQAGRLWNSELSGYRLTRIFFDLTKLGRQPFLHSSCCSLAPFTFHEHYRTALSFRYFSGSVLDRRIYSSRPNLSWKPSVLGSLWAMTHHQQYEFHENAWISRCSPPWAKINIQTPVSPSVSADDL